MQNNLTQKKIIIKKEEKCELTLEVIDKANLQHVSSLPDIDLYVPGPVFQDCLHIIPYVSKDCPIYLSFRSPWVTEKKRIKEGKELKN